jgi:hypothetical protein
MRYLSIEGILDSLGKRFFPPGGDLALKTVISRLNPDKLYLESVRSVLGVSYQAALDFCEAAVRQGHFTRGFEVACPDGVIAASAGTEEELPETVTCWIKDGENIEEKELSTASLKKTVFYRLNG